MIQEYFKMPEDISKIRFRAIIGSPLFVTFIFLFGVFYLATPYRLDWSTDIYSTVFSEEGGKGFDLMGKVEEGSLGRRLALLALAMFGIDTILRKRTMNLRPYGPLFHFSFFYIILATASIAWADEFALTLRKISILWFLGMGAVAVCARLDLKQIITLVMGITGLTLLISVFAEIYLGAMRPFDGTYRFTGVMNPVAQGWNCGLFVLSSLCLSGLRKKWVYYALTCLGLIFMLLTKSRMPFVSTMMASALLFGMVVSIKPKTKLLIASWIVIFCCLAFFFTENNYISHPKKLMQMGRTGDGSADISTLTGRTELWKHLLALSAERLIFGYGYNTFQTPAIINQLGVVMDWMPSNSHSGYIQNLLGLGIAGLTLFLAILLAGFLTAFKRSTTGKEYAFVAAFFLWMFLNLLLESTILSEPVFPAFLFYLLIFHLSVVTPFKKHDVMDKKI